MDHLQKEGACEHRKEEKIVFMKTLNVIFRREAQEDIATISRYIAKDSPEAARNFFVALDDSCELLAHTPDIGSARIFQSPRLHGMRIIPIRKFEK